MKRKGGGFRYVYSRKKAEAYQKLSIEERLCWLEEMSRFLFAFMPATRRAFMEKLRRGES